MSERVFSEQPIGSTFFKDYGNHKQDTWPVFITSDAIIAVNRPEDPASEENLQIEPINWITIIDRRRRHFSAELQHQFRTSDLPQTHTPTHTSD